LTAICVKATMNTCPPERWKGLNMLLATGRNSAEATV
jgi:hypothetical protein